jgi:hypothetical protein
MEFNTGAIRKPEDPRDFQYGKQIGFATTPFDWEQGYDAEKDFKLKVKNQNGSFACGGFAVSSYAEMIFGTEKSPKFIYAPIKAPGGGSDIYSLMNRLRDVGACDESLCSSFPNGVPPTEDWMNPKDITTQAIENAGKYRTTAYAFVNRNFDEMARAIRDNQGMIMGISGQDNGTWYSAFPKVPTLGNSGWNHWVYAIKAKKINGKKMIGFLNSWGSVGENGIQWIGEEWLDWLWALTTMVVLDQPKTTFKFTKDLWISVTDNEVKELQKYLNNNGFPVAISGAGSKGKETNYFGVLTKNALVRFQMAHNIYPAKGYFGKITRSFVNNILLK